MITSIQPPTQIKPFPLKAVMKPWNKTVPDLNKLRYPKIIQPKIDGILCHYYDGTIYSAARKPLPNRYVGGKLKEILELKFGKEIILIGELQAFKGAPYYETSSAIMSDHVEPLHFQFVLFDLLSVNLTLKKILVNIPYKTRRNAIACLFPPHHTYEHIDSQTCFGHTVMGAAEALQWEQFYLDNHYEGAILRDPESPYKIGRSTLKEEYLLKLKRFTDGEARITGFTELLTEDTHKPCNILGALEVQDLKTLASFKIGTGFTESMRARFWMNRNAGLKGRTIKYKYQAFGTKDKSRIPVFLGFRDMEKGDV